MAHDTALPYLPRHLVDRILVHLDLDTRVALRVLPRPLDPARLAAAERHLRRRQARVRHSPASGLTWARVPVAGTRKQLSFSTFGQCGWLTLTDRRDPGALESWRLW